MKVDRQDIRDIRQLALSFSAELLNVAYDLSQKAIDSRSDTVDVIDTLASAIDAIRDDTAEFYQAQYDNLTEQFFKYEPIA